MNYAIELLGIPRFCSGLAVFSLVRHFVYILFPQFSRENLRPLFFQLVSYFAPVFSTEHSFFSKKLPSL